MNNSLFFKSKFVAIKVILSLLSLLALSGCPGGGGSGEISLTNQPGASSGTYAVTVQTVNSKDSTQWIADANGVPYSTSLAVTFSGTCTRGVSKIVAYIDGSNSAESNQGTCDSLGNYSLSLTFAAPDSSTEREGVVHSIEFKAVLADGSVATAGSATRTVNIDIHGPTFGSITHTGSGSGPYYVSPSAGEEGNASFTVSGTVSADTVSMTGTSTVATDLNVSFSGTSYTAAAILASGGQDAMVLTAYDRAGNSTASSSISTEYVNSINTPAFAASSSAVGGGVIKSTSPIFVGTVGGLGSEITGDFQVILGMPGVYTKYNP